VASVDETILPVVAGSTVVDAASASLPSQGAELIVEGVRQLGDLFAEGATATAERRNTDAVSIYRKAERLAEDLGSELGRMGCDPTIEGEVATVLRREEPDPEVLASQAPEFTRLAFEGTGLAAGLLAFTEGLAALAEGRFAHGSASFGAAEELLQPFADWSLLPTGRFHIPYARTMAKLCSGQNQIRLGSRSEGIKELQIAAARARKELSPLLDDLEPEIADALRADIEGIEVAVGVARAMQDYTTARFASAEQRAKEVRSRVAAMIEVLRQSNMPRLQKEFLLSAQEATFATGTVYLALAQGELARVARRWDDAVAAYDQAQAAFDEMSQAMAAIDTPAAADAQSFALNQMLVDIARRRYEDDRRLWEQIEIARADARRAEAEKDKAEAEKDSWRSALESLRQLGITVNVSNQADASAAAEAFAKNTASLNQAIHQQLLSDLDALQHAIGQSPLPDAESAKLQSEIEALKVAGKADKTEGFLEKVGSFVERSAKVLDTLEKAAGPLGKVARWVVPMAPIAAHALGLA
jgi:hypothetical protein